MQSTTNYSMNILEGTDIVNVPVQLNPNFQTIDSEMFKNKQSGIGTATEVVTGTVHAIVRNNLDADVFRFTATGAWASGDTMTLDGTAVTVHMADGTAPTAGAYIIGAEVLAIVNGTLVTLLTSNGAIDPGVTSFNSRTGAVTPEASDYDASMIDYDNTGSGLVATDVQSAIDELAASTINLQYVTKATSSANATYSSQLAEIKNAYLALSTEEKERSILDMEGTLLNIQDIATGRYCGVFMTATDLKGICVRFTDNTYKTSTGTAVTDYSSSINSGTIKLKVLTA